MTSTSSDYSLSQMLQLAANRKWFILILTLVTVLVCSAVFLVFPKMYKAETIFILKNPLFADRGNIYSEPKSMNYFANEDEVIRFISMANIDSLKNETISKFDLLHVYNLEAGKEKDSQTALKIFSQSLVLHREESNDIVLLFTDKDAVRAAEIANFYVQLMEHSFRNFYNEMKLEMYQSIQLKIKEQDSAINALTDSLVLLRDKYSIYELISPSRHNLMTGILKPEGRAGFAKGIEVIQNIESVKDEMVSDRSHKITLLSQYTTGYKINNITSLVQIMKKAQTPVRKDGIGLIGIIIVSTFFGFFISLFYVLVHARIMKAE